MTNESTGHPLSGVSVVIPALNEADSLSVLLPRLATLHVGEVLVCDNGSTDATREVSERLGARWIFAPHRGYGAACFAGIEQLSPQSLVVAFVDADQGEEVGLLPNLAVPILKDQRDLVIGTRSAHLRASGSATWPQRFGNWLLPKLVRLGWGHRYTDLGPFRAIRRESLLAIGMRDRAFGWTIEMQIRAVELGLRIAEIPVPHHKRAFGRSKVSGSIKGVVLAGYWIIRTCATLWVTKRRRLR